MLAVSILQPLETPLASAIQNMSQTKAGSAALSAKLAAFGAAVTFHIETKAQSTMRGLQLIRHRASSVDTA